MRFFQVFIGAVVALAVVRGWVLPLTDTFWVDEAGTYWTILGGWREVWERTGMHQNSRFYSLLLWAWAQVVGLSEVALRLPSLVAVMAAVGLLGWFVERRVGAGSGWQLVALAAVSPQLQFYAADARPYGMALLLGVMTMILAAAWREQPLMRLGWWWGLAGGLMVWLHPVTAVALVAQGAWLLGTLRGAIGEQRRWRSCAVAVAVMVAMAALELSRLAAFQGRNTSSVHFRPDTGWRFVRMLLPLWPVAPLVAAVAGAWWWARRHSRGEEASQELLWLGGATVTIPVVLVTMVRLTTKIELMLDRYLVVVLAGWLLLMVVGSARWLTGKGRVVFTLVFVAVGLGGQLWNSGWQVRHSDADWRGALRAVREWDRGRRLPVYIQSGFVEAKQTRFLTKPEWREYLLAPVLAYPVPGEAHVLPIHAVADYPIDEPGGFWLVVYEDNGASLYLTGYEERARLRGRFRRLAVYEIR
jgi:hypothetical protein